MITEVKNKLERLYEEFEIVRKLEDKEQIIYQCLVKEETLIWKVILVHYLKNCDTFAIFTKTY